MAVLHTEGDMVMADTLELEEMQPKSGLSLALGEVEKKQILRVLAQTKGNRTLAAEILGIGRTTLYNKMKAYGIE